RYHPGSNIIVYEYLADNLNNVLYTRPQRKLEEEEVKKVTRVVLQGLVTMHEKNLAHTDIKSDNIVSRLQNIALLTLPIAHQKGLFGLPWTIKVDPWALGTLIIWGLTGARIFGPPAVDEKDEIYHVMILMLQCAYFGHFPNKDVQLSDYLTIGDLDGIEGLVTQRGGRRKYRNTLATNMSKETVRFLDKVMKLDPRDRPTPQELLQDQWLSGVVD
ncbi:hypothetical protein MMC18_009587, partial [Xylographa bjoerkii]|nr:hypothetical protein [Xylographa bjoerkii]